MSGPHNDDRNPDPTTHGSEGRSGRLKEEKKDIHEGLRTMTEEQSVPGRIGRTGNGTPSVPSFQVTLLTLNNTEVSIPDVM